MSCGLEMKLVFIVFTSFCHLSIVHSCLSGGGIPLPEIPGITDATTILRSFLGGDITVEHTPFDSTGQLIDKSNDLNCYGPTAGRPHCRWRNAAPPELLDEFEWLKGTGRADPNKWKTIMRKMAMPSEPYLVLAAVPSPGTNKGLLISDPIGCQEGEGVLTLKYWISRSHSPLWEPKLFVCWKYRDNRELKDCTQLVIDTTNLKTVTRSVTISGPIRRPFEIVLRGENFSNFPEGGIMVVDDIKYRAKVMKQCIDDGDDENGDVNDEVHDPNGGGGGGDPDDDDDDDEYPDDDDDEYPDEDDYEEVDNDDVPLSDVESCDKLTCNFLNDPDFCELQPIGLGSRDVGERLGWLVVPGIDNPTNPLTGVRKDIHGSKDGSFAVAAFPDPHQDPSEPQLQFSLESPQLLLSMPYYLHFKRYMATIGIELLICKDPDGIECIWESPPLIRGKNKAQQNREWRVEMIRLPAGNYKLYLLGRYDGNEQFNAGQIGLSHLKLYRDVDTTRLLC